MSPLSGPARLEAAIRSPKRPGRPAIMPYVTSGYPTREGFAQLLADVSEVADAIEVGVPFSDPMADGPTIQVSSRIALESGVTLPWILQTLGGLSDPAPMVLMSYLNPLLAYGVDRLMRDAAQVGVCGFIIPDLPWEEGDDMRAQAEAHGLGVVQLVTPITPPDRLATLTAGSRGFVYAVTITGVTGAAGLPADLSVYLDRVRAVSPVPVCAGFGVRTAADVAALRGHADGAIVGTAFIEALTRGADPGRWLRQLAGA